MTVTVGESGSVVKEDGIDSTNRRFTRKMEIRTGMGVLGKKFFLVLKILRLVSYRQVK